LLLPPHPYQQAQQQDKTSRRPGNRERQAKKKLPEGSFF